MAELTNKEIRELEMTYGIYAFESPDGRMDGFFLVEALRALGLFPSLALAAELGGSPNRNETWVSLDDFIRIYSDVRKQMAAAPNLTEYLEILKLYEGKKAGKIPKLELLYVLQNLGEKLTEDETLAIMKECCPPEDSNGNIRYEKFVTRVLKGPRLVDAEEEKDEKEKPDE